MEVKIHKAKKQGWLSKVNKRRKIFGTEKSYWFALDNTNLYYFTNDSANILKGKFPLNIYDECEISDDNKKLFRLSSSSDKNVKTIILISPSEDTTKEWVKSIKTNIEMSKDIYTKYGPGIYRRESSLYIQIDEAKDLPDSYNVYCIVCVDHIQRARTPISEKTDSPTFFQEYDLDIDPNNKTVTIILKGQRFLKGDCVISAYKKDISGIHNFVVDEWVQLVSNDGKNAGSLRLRLEYFTLTVLPDEYYDPLFSALVKDNMKVAKTISSVVSQESRFAAECLVRAFDSRKLSVHFIKEMMKFEIENTEDINLLFRGNSVATHSLDIFMKLAGKQYLSKVIKPIVEEIYQGKKACEIDPSKCKNSLIDGNCNNLTSFVDKVLNSISSSLIYCPSSFRDIFKHIQESIIKKFPQHKKTKYVGPSGFIFLRFFCPAILNPFLFDIVKEFPSEKVNRDLTLIAKTLQSIANLTTFSQGKEIYMSTLNSFVKKKIPFLKQYINALCSPLTEPIDELPNERNIKFGREMARIHKGVTDILPTIKMKFDKVELQDVIKEIKNISNELNNKFLLHSHSQPEITTKNRSNTIKSIKSQPTIQRRIKRSSTIDG